MNLDYSTLTQPVTPEDIAAFRKWRGKDPFDQSKPAIMRVLIILIVFFLFINVGPLLLAGKPLGSSSSYFVLLVLVIVALSIGFTRINVKKQTRLYKFAVSNQATLLLNSPSRRLDGMIFDEGHSRTITNGLILSDGTEISNYQYTIGGGKNRRTYTWGYAVIKLSRRLPHMVLDAKQNNNFGFSNLPDSFRGQTLALEGDFNEHFTLYAPKKYERDALYVFTPDVMAALIDSGSTYDIEIIDDNVILYSSSTIPLDSPQHLSSLITIIDKIGSEIRDQSHRYADERVPDTDANIVATPGRRLQSKTGIGTIIVVIIFIAYLGLSIANWTS